METSHETRVGNVGDVSVNRTFPLQDSLQCAVNLGVGRDLGEGWGLSSEFPRLV